ncbi:MAG: hypothetical protein IH897_06990, partial [Planctomycetes bacterium]|nr:hypothetical protein [Planctomycetota bacterium]
LPEAPTFATLTELLFGPERHAVVDALMWQRVSAWGGPLAAGVVPLGLVAVALVAVSRTGRSARAVLAAVGFMLVGYYVVYLLTPLDVEWLVSTTFDRVIVQIWPSLVLAGFLTDDGPNAGRSPESP